MVTTTQEPEQKVDIGTIIRIDKSKTEVKATEVRTSPLGNKFRWYLLKSLGTGHKWYGEKSVLARIWVMNNTHRTIERLKYGSIRVKIRFSRRPHQSNYGKPTFSYMRTLSVTITNPQHTHRAEKKVSLPIPLEQLDNHAMYLNDLLNGPLTFNHPGQKFFRREIDKVLRSINEKEIKAGRPAILVDHKSDRR